MPWCRAEVTKPAAHVADLIGAAAVLQHVLISAISLFAKAAMWSSTARISGKVAPQPPMWGPNKEGEPVPVASDEERPLPNARRQINRRSQGK